MTKPRDEKYGMTFERVDYALRYEPDTGNFYWKVAFSDKTRVGIIAGGINRQGYHRVRIDGHYYLGHRLAWLLIHKEWPAVEIDHINRVKNDNRLCNLREATHSQNHANTGLRSDNTTGYKGVQWDKQKQKYIAIAFKNKKRIHVGFFDDPKKAHEAYCEKSREIHGDYHDMGL